MTDGTARSIPSMTNAITDGPRRGVAYRCQRITIQLGMIRRVLAILSCLIVLAAGAPLASLHAAVGGAAATEHSMADADHNALAMDVGGHASASGMAGCCIGGLASCPFHLSVPLGQLALRNGNAWAEAVLRPGSGQRLHGIAQDVPYEPPRL